MDGTGNLFSPILMELEQHDVQIITLPQTGKQDYDTLTSYVQQKLPDTEYVLIAESFSGPIAALLAMQGHHMMRGIIFVATFLSPPHPALLNIVKFLPIKWMMSLPFSKSIYRALLFEKNTAIKTIELFETTLHPISQSLIKQRIT